MQLVFSNQPMPTSVVKSLFLAGPSPRRADEPDWRPEAVAHLKAAGFDGTVFIPIPSHRFAGEFEDREGWTYDGQVSWECAARKMADVLVFWVPRVIDRSKPDLGMPAFTTNFEMGEDLHSGRVMYGRPDSAAKCSYLDQRVQAMGQRVHAHLPELLDAVMQELGDGAERVGGEAQVPLFIWRSRSFQRWYANMKAACNRLDGADVLNHVRVGSGHLFAYTLQVNVWVQSEQRHKSNEFIFARNDISTVVALYRDPNAHNGVHVALVREFRSPVNNPRGFVYELPGGSAAKDGVDPLHNAQHELHEELGLLVDDLSRLRVVGERQLMATVSVHQAQVYAVELTRDEFTRLQSLAASREPQGLLAEGERTYVELTTLDQLHELPLDFSMLGMVHEAVRVLGLSRSKASSVPPLRLHTPGFNDEQLEVRLGDELLLTADHDRHGWDGMDLARNLVTRLGEHLKIPVLRTEGEMDD